jgi:hypothetical protein
MLSYCKNLKKGRPLAFILAIVLVVAMALSVSAFAPMQSWADPGESQVSLDTYSPVTIDWNVSRYDGIVANHRDPSDIPNMLTFWVDKSGGMPVVTPNAPATIAVQYGSGSYEVYYLDTRYLTTTQVALTVDYGPDEVYHIQSPPPKSTYGYALAVNGGFDLTFGEPPYSPTPPESDMAFTQIGADEYLATYDQSIPYPGVFMLGVYPKGNYDVNSLVLTESDPNLVNPMLFPASGVDGTSGFLLVYLNSGGATYDDYWVNLATDDGAYEMTVYFYPPGYTPTPPTTSAIYPSAVDGYLPLGREADGNGWGSISRDNENTLDYPGDLAAYDKNVKSIEGMESEGVSLGTGGGYVQYEFETPITNSAVNTYGVDFIVYGNAFDGNSEAGSVQVSNDGDTWYELAGSRYYNDDTQRNVDVSYRIDPNSTDIDYQFASVGGIIHPWDTFFANDTSPWPQYAPKSAGGENYGIASGVRGPYPPATKTPSFVDYTPGSDPITYHSVTLIEGSFTTSEFSFGYADVTANGGGPYDEAQNPYNNKGTGGDGFDLSWAVDTDGNPVVLSEAKYIRIYTASALDPNDPTSFVLPQGAVGEISTEVCGVFRATGTGGSAATTDVAVYDQYYNPVPISNMGMETITVSALTPATYYIYSAEPNVFVNNDKVDASNLYPISVTLASGQTAYYRIITQHNMESPYITVLKFVAQ